MLRSFRKLLMVLALAAGLAAALALCRSSDPLYTIEEWVYQARYRRYDAVIREIGKKYGVDPRLVKAVIWRESGFNPRKVGKNGERGLMQVTEGAANEWARATKRENFVAADLFDGRTNIQAGTWYLKQALIRWSGRDDPVPFALAEYNAGRRRVERWIGPGNIGDRAMADDLLDNIGFPGTRAYVDTILRRYDFYKERGD